MWQFLKTNLKKYNQWYDKQGEAARFWPLVSLTIVGLLLINSDTAIISLLGWAYFALFIGIRWMHINGKL